MIAIFRLNYEVVYKTFWKSLCDKVEILSRSFPRLVYSNLGFTRCQYFSGIVLSSQSAFYYSVTIFTPTPVVKQSHLHNYNTTVVPITRSKTKTKKKGNDKTSNLRSDSLKAGKCCWQATLTFPMDNSSYSNGTNSLGPTLEYFWTFPDIIDLRRWNLIYQMGKLRRRPYVLAFSFA